MHHKNFEKSNFRNQRGPQIVGAPNNEFGTRLCQRVECSRCHKVDYVAKKINGAKTIYCRDCAEKFLETFESGRKIAEKKVARTCEHCKREFLISEAIANKKPELQCQDCLNGFEVWRGKVSEQTSNQALRAISLAGGAKVIIRKRTNDKV